MLKIGESFVFEDDWSDRRSSLMFFAGDEDEPPSWSVDVGFAEGDFDGERIRPSICINPVETDKKSAAELEGESFSTAAIEECLGREDTFYIYEHEPPVCYELEIAEIKDGRARIKCRGTLVADGYAKPYVTEKFEIDSWVPVIESLKDWEKFGL